MKKKLVLLGIVIILISAFIGFRYYNFIFSDNVKSLSEEIIFVPTNSSFSSLLDTIESKNILEDISAFIGVAKRMKFNRVKSGKYIIQPEWNNKEIVGHFRSGNQSPVKLTFNNVRTINDLAGIFAEKLESDSLSFLNYFTDTSYIRPLGYTSENILSAFIPNTYDLFWNSEPKDVLDKMIIENKKFWNDDRTKQLNNLIFSKREVYTLASIVQKETNRNSEKAIMAGVYINRIKRGIPLQADPTVVFAVGDFSIRRVLNKHIAIESPYNTYKNAGLPPGPICMPDISSIDAVLNYEDHRYIYFCASPGEPGGHVFAKTLSEHNRNARAYQRWLNQRKIFK